MAIKDGSGIEILVHASARSTARDDTRYRALAQAYLAFEPVSRTALSDALTDEESYVAEDDDEESAQSQLYDELLGATPTTSAAQKAEITRRRSPDTDYSLSIPSSIPPFSSRFKSLNSPQASFNSILDNRNSPGLKGLKAVGNQPSSSVPQEIEQSQSEHSWIPPPSVLSDSQPQSQQLEDTTIYSSPITVLQALLDQSRDVLPLPPTITYDITDDPSEEPTSSPPVLQISSKNIAIVPKSFSEAFSSSIPVSSPVQLPPPSTPSVNSSQIQLVSSIPTSSLDRKHDIPSSDQISARKRQRPSIKAKDTTLEIHPHPPQTSTSDLSVQSFITIPLQNLAQQLSFTARYRPSSQTRHLRPMERGYWLVDCREWPADLKARSWAFLEGYIANGNAGWGVWCTRDEEKEFLRAYCWGEVVGYIYLLLYLVSERKLKGKGSKWVDGEGVAVITMPLTP